MKSSLKLPKISDKLYKKPTLLDKINWFSHNNPILVTIMVAVTVISALLTLSQGIGLLNKILSVFTYKTQLYSKLSNLNPGINISIYIDNFGQPTITKNINKGKEYIFVNKYFYLQAITNNEGLVLYFSVTTKDENFKPTFITPDQSRKITLNASTFQNFSPEVTTTTDKFIGTSYSPECSGYMGAHDFYYYEIDYMGNPGKYQTAVVGLNDAGNIKAEPNYVDLNDCKNISNMQRKNMVINTYGEFGAFENSPFPEENKRDFKLGVDNNEVRVLER